MPIGGSDPNIDQATILDIHYLFGLIDSFYRLWWIPKNNTKKNKNIRSATVREINIYINTLTTRLIDKTFNTYYITDSAWRETNRLVQYIWLIKSMPVAQWRPSIELLDGSSLAIRMSALETTSVSYRWKLLIMDTQWPIVVLLESLQSRPIVHIGPHIPSIKEWPETMTHRGSCRSAECHLVHSIRRCGATPMLGR